MNKMAANYLKENSSIERRAMMAKIIYFLVTFLLLCFFLYAPVSHSGGDGEALFKSKCGQCHRSGGEAPVFSPVKFAGSQWERFFTRDKHKRKKDISGEINAADIDAIKQYLIDHAADSDQPEAAGLK